jgi:hypothetical protein
VRDISLRYPGIEGEMQKLTFGSRQTRSCRLLL